MACPDENTVAAFLEGALSREEMAAVEGHVAACDACRSLLSSLVRADGAEAAPDTLLELSGATLVEESGDADQPPSGDTTLVARGSDEGSGSTLQARDRVDQYRVIRRVGRGGMGEVYLARDTRLGRKVALKVIHAHLLDSRAAVEGFLVEARNTARFNHPHIVTLYGVGEHRGTPYMALEYIEGQTLQQRMLEEGQSLAEAVRLGLAVAGALHEAHGRGVLHLDLTANNVVIPRDGRARVLDFGLSQAINPLRRSETGTLLTAVDAMELSRDGISSHGLQGTPSYMAPEQWRERRLTASTDVWSLGVLLFQLMAGRHPFCHPKPRSVAQLVGRVCQDEVSLPEDLGLPQPVREVLDGCLCKDPDGRPTAEEVMEALTHALDSIRELPPVAESPFRGMLPFTGKHAGLFFGRDADLAAFLERLRLLPVLPVVGTSGAGKSSFVRAGVLPRLREQGAWRVLQMRPGVEPLLALAQRVVGLEAGPHRPGEAEELAAERSSLDHAFRGVGGLTVARSSKRAATPKGPFRTTAKVADFKLVSGSLELAAATRAVRRALGGFRSTYERLLRRDPSFSVGPLTVEISVQTTGRTSGCTVSPAGTSATLEAGIKRYVERLRFPPPKAGPAKIRFKLVLKKFSKQKATP